MISIVVITLNEEKNIENLLEALLKQTYEDFEVIIIDSDSKDRTAEIAKSYKNRLKRLYFYNIKKRGVSLARNIGAEKAKGEYIFFMDADITFNEDFLEKSIGKLKRKKLDCAGVYMKSMSNNVLDNFYYAFLNFWFFITQKIYPHCVGSCMISTKNVQKRIKGFDTTIRLAEDNDYINRARKCSKFGIINERVSVSARRFEKEGRLRMGIKYILVFFYRIFFGEIRKDIFKYRFGYYEEKKK